MLELAISPDSSACGAPILAPADLPRAPVSGLYVHIPFCFHKCHYCDFYSITRQTPERMQQFVDRILWEADQWSPSKALPRIEPQTIFFGGGTPSLLPLPQMRRLIEGLRSRFNLSGVREWTVEINPATASFDYCRMLRESGVDRLSFGAQSFNPAELATLERHHHPGDIPRSVEIARCAGFSRINLDLIFAIPGQDMESWSRSLETAIAFQTPHLSCYALTYEPNTPMAVRKRMGQFSAAEESLELEMLHHVRNRLSAIGLHPYEVSNFATPGEECLHNLNYWLGGNYLGLGPSAASHIEGHRWRNRPHIGEWESAIAAGKLPVTDVEALTPPRRAGELAMLMLRLARGIDAGYFKEKTNHDPRTLYADVVQRLAPAGLLEVTDATIRLTAKGLNIADAIAAEFLSSGQEI